MGLFSYFSRKTEGASEKALSASPAVLEALRIGQLNPYPALGGTNVNARVANAFQRGLSAQLGWMYGTQPAVRSVIDYIADNASQLTLHLYERTAEGERERAPDHAAIKSLYYPNEWTTQRSLFKQLFTDYLIWGNAYFVKFRGAAQGRLVLARVLPSTVTVAGGRFSADAYWFWREDGTPYGPVPPDMVFHWRGYNPNDPLLGLSKLETLRQELASDAAISTALVELAKAGLKGGHIERPEGAEWTPEDRNRFFELWKAAKADPQGTPILDEGMTYVQDSISPKDASVIDARQFTTDVVSAQFGMEKIPPQTEEERMQFYSDVLAPLIGEFACQLDLDILQKEYRTTDYFFELDLNEKAYRDPWRLWSIFTSAAGAPFASRDEIRNLVGLPAKGGPADELILPGNVAVEGDETLPSLPAPNVMPIQDPNKPSQDGSYRENGQKAFSPIPRRAKADARRNRWAKKYEDTLVKHFTRQAQSLKSAKKAVIDERWDTELATELASVSRRHFEAEGAQAAFRLAIAFDSEQGQNWLQSKAEDAAKSINATTQQQIDAAEDMAEAFAAAKTTRATAGGLGYATDIAAFAARVALEQAPGKRTVTIDGGDCEVCAEFQGTWPAEDVPGWPAYHPGCDCVADPS